MVRKLLPLVVVGGIVLLTLYFTRSRTGQSGNLVPVTSIGISGGNEPWQAGQVTQRPTVLQSRSSQDVSSSLVETDLPPMAANASPLTADAVPQAQLRLPRDLGSSWMRSVEGSAGDAVKGPAADDVRHEVNRPREAQEAESRASAFVPTDAAAAATPTYPVSAPLQTPAPTSESPPVRTPSAPAPSIAGTSTTVSPTPEFPEPVTPEPQITTSPVPADTTLLVHIVRPGESLVDIARQHLGQGTRWMEIYRLNREQLGSQVQILQPGMRLQLPPR